MSKLIINLVSHTESLVLHTESLVLGFLKSLVTNCIYTKIKVSDLSPKHV